jgi:uncharacterized membrane protein YdfJ with MMPL/SSD domain
MSDGAKVPRGAAAFERLGRAAVRRPLVPIVVWVVLLAVTVPFLGRLGSVTSNSAETVPSSAPSAVASAKFAELFPNSTGGSSAIVLFTGADLVDARGQGLVMNATSALQGDRSLADVAAVQSVYTVYAGYLAGQAVLAGEAIAAAQDASANLTTAVNATATLLWSPPTTYLTTWEGLVANGTSTASANPAAYNRTAAAYSGSSPSLAVLAAFYGGYGGSTTGFNGSTADCAGALPDLGAVAACANASARANLLPLAPHLTGVNTTVAAAVLGGAGVDDAGAPSVQLAIAATIVGDGSGLDPAWVLQVWQQFGGAAPTASQASAYANTTVDGTTLASEPIPVPLAISSRFVNPAGTASLINVAFSVADDTTNASGGQPVYADLAAIDRLVGGVVADAAPAGGYRYYLTGTAPLDQLTGQAVNSSLGLVLPLTVGLLLGIAMLYFRSPLAPLVAFLGLGIALVLGLGGTVLIGAFVTHVDSSALALEEVFVLGVGTDYSIFLLARYREELVRGRPSEEAVVAAVTWAGQSIAISGSTAIIVTVALAFSGVALLAEWGMVLSIAILTTILVALTLLPALLRLVGPRLFWPMTGARFTRAAETTNARAASGSTYFYRAARFSERRAPWVVATVVLVSLPIVAVALQVPVSYDFYDQLPSGHSATQGLAELGSRYGNGFAVPSYALVTFSDPLLSGSTPEVAEFEAVANLTAIANATPGIAAIRSPVGPYGAPLADWLAFASAPASAQQELRATLGAYVGTDGRTVLLQLQTNDTGLSFGAVRALGAVESSYGAYRSGHPEVTALAFGGGAPTIQDLADETSLATEVMLVAVTVGLVLVLLAVLRSWIIALMAVATIGLSICWAWAVSDLVLQQLLAVPIFFYVRTILIMLVLGLGIDYNIFLLTRIREERLRGRSTAGATVEAVGRTGGIITAAAVILASAFASLLVGEFTLIRAIGFAVAVAVVMDAMVVRTYLVPATLHLLGDRVWSLSGRSPPARAPAAPDAAPPAAGPSP